MPRRCPEPTISRSSRAIKTSPASNSTAMKKISSQLRQLSNPLLILLFLAAAAAAAMAAEPEKQAAPAAQEETAVHIVYVDRPEDAEPEEFHLRTLTPVLGSEQKARDAVLYHYKNAASGFSAKLTPKQVEDLKEQPGVLQVVPSQTYQLHGPGAGARQGTTRILGGLF